MSPPSFGRWIAAVFDRPRRSPPTFAPPAEALILAPELALEYVTRLFEDAGRTLAPFDDARVNRGLWDLAGASGDLHGLGRWSLQYPERIHRIVDRFLEETPTLDPALRAYALAARGSCIQ